MGYGVVSSSILGNRKLTGGIGLQPNPAASEERDTALLELRLESIYASPLAGNLLAERRSRLGGRDEGSGPG